MKLIFTTESNINKSLLKRLHINTKEQHCSVNSIYFLCEQYHTKYQTYQVYNLCAHALSMFYKQSNLKESLSKLLFEQCKTILVCKHYFLFLTKAFFVYLLLLVILALILVFSVQIQIGFFSFGYLSLVLLEFFHLM